jgi:glutamyl-tRNA synthetase
MIITRFAPSPTGSLHIGGARTALFNYLYAKHCNGKFLLRFEDTDQARSTIEHANQIKESLKWLGINWDNEDIPFQSKRLHIYESYKDHLIEKKLAYIKDGAVFLKGKNDVEDFVIWRSDGMPVFHFAVVIDDHEMNVNCIIRGVDHLTNTEKHKIIYEYLEFPMPSWHHIPLIVDENDKPLSKRRNDASTEFYKQKEYLADAMVNYLARLGWGHENQEIFSRKELISLFDIQKVSKNPAKVDIKKLNWLNAQYVSNSSLEDLKQYTAYSNIIKAVEKSTLSELYQECLHKLQKKAFTLEELNNLLDPFVNNFSANADIIQNNIDFISNYLLPIKTLLENVSLENWTEELLENKFNEFLNKHNYEMKAIAMPLREILTGQKKSLGIVDIFVYLGRKNVLNRLHIL